MAKNRWRLERQFGVSVGMVLVAVALWLRWRGHDGLLLFVPAALGGILAVAGACCPRVLVYPNRGWMVLSVGLAWVSTRVILGLLFFLVFAPLGAWRRMRGWDPLNRRAPADRASFWQPYSDRQADPRHYEKMF